MACRISDADKPAYKPVKPSFFTIDASAAPSPGRAAPRAAPCAITCSRVLATSIGETQKDALAGQGARGE